MHNKIICEQSTVKSLAWLYGHKRIFKYTLITDNGDLGKR